MAKPKGNYRKINLKKRTFTPRGVHKAGQGKYGKKKWFGKKKGDGSRRPNSCYLCGGEDHWAADCPHTNALRKDAFDISLILDEELSAIIVDDLKENEPQQDLERIQSFDDSLNL